MEDGDDTAFIGRQVVAALPPSIDGSHDGTRLPRELQSAKNHVFVF